MNKENKQLKNIELENVTGGYTIKPKEDEMWYSFNPLAYNPGDEGYFKNN